MTATERLSFAGSLSFASLVAGCASSLGTTGDGSIADSASIDAVSVDRATTDDRAEADAFDAVEPLDGHENIESVPVGSIFAIVQVREVWSNNGRERTPDASAMFYRRLAASVLGGNCRTTTAGRCVVQRCDGDDAGANPSATERVPAGSVYLDGLPGGTTELNWSPGYGYLRSLSGAAWRGGETVTVRATGESTGMPMFSVSEAAPAPVRVVEPASGIAARIPSAVPFTIRWTGGGPDVVRVVLGAGITGGASTPPASITVNCDFPAVDGTGEIPIEVLQPMAGHGAGVVILATRTRTIRVGTHLVTLVLKHQVASGLANVE
ncbi:MAG: hypothetical protein Q8S73_09145 [Deltaproteobacteria bacterium]|nr:hypothetical protein [Myxococcales bacterium]MDP3214257.1 hypothetical protein [Deltaproteobacteria bacterium]